MKHPLEFDGPMSNPKHCLLTGGDLKHKASYVAISLIMYAAGWAIGILIWILSFIDRRMYGRRY